MADTENNQSVTGLSENEIEQIRQLKGLLQAEVPDSEFTNADTVMWAVENEIERQRGDA